MPLTQEPVACRAVFRGVQPFRAQLMKGSRLNNLCYQKSVFLLYFCTLSLYDLKFVHLFDIDMMKKREII